MSSARVVRCWVKSRNERNPYCMLLTGKAEDSYGTAGVSRRKVGMTSNHHAPYVQGYRRATMASITRCNIVKWSKSLKLVSVRIGVCNSTP